MTLVTAPTGSSVGAFCNGTVYDLKNSLNVRAEPVSGVASVIFKLDGAFLRTENYQPYVAAEINTGVNTGVNTTHGSRRWERIPSPPSPTVKILAKA